MWCDELSERERLRIDGQKTEGNYSTMLLVQKRLQFMTSSSRAGCIRSLALDVAVRGLLPISFRHPMRRRRIATHTLKPISGSFITSLLHCKLPSVT
jgi:hypothetical protein